MSSQNIFERAKFFYKNRKNIFLARKIFSEEITASTPSEQKIFLKTLATRIYCDFQKYFQNLKMILNAQK